MSSWCWTWCGTALLLTRRATYFFAARWQIQVFAALALAAVPFFGGLSARPGATATAVAASTRAAVEIVNCACSYPQRVWLVLRLCPCSRKE